MSPSRSSTGAADRFRGWPVGVAAGLLLAIAVYVLLHRLVTDEAPPAFAMATGLAAAVEIGQYALPALVLAATAFAIWRGRGGGKVALARHSPEEIHALLSDAFQGQGYQVVDKAAGAGDARVDLVLRRGRESFLVWARTWHDARVDVEAVQRLCRAMAARDASGGFIVTTGRFGREATAYAGSHNVRLIDGATLRGMLGPRTRI